MPCDWLYNLQGWWHAGRERRRGEDARKGKGENMKGGKGKSKGKRGQGEGRKGKRERGGAKQGDRHNIDTIM